jgi:hypothetical protein
MAFMNRIVDWIMFISVLDMMSKLFFIDHIHILTTFCLRYMYQVCVQNKCTLPSEALYIIRYHSFYSWHTHSKIDVFSVLLFFNVFFAEAYDHLCNDDDRAAHKWVKVII